MERQSAAQRMLKIAHKVGHGKLGVGESLHLGSRVRAIRSSELALAT